MPEKTSRSTGYHNAVAIEHDSDEFDKPDQLAPVRGRKMT